MTTRTETVHAFYAALADGDRDQLHALLHAEFAGRLADGMPFGIGGLHETPQAMLREGWGVIARHFKAKAEPAEIVDLSDGRILVTGRYAGHGKQGGAALDANFAHVIGFEGGRIRTLEQFTDTARWHAAAAVLKAVTLNIHDGIATLRLNRPDHGNAIDLQMAEDLAEAATLIAEDASVRAVMIAARGAKFTVGGDIDVFVNTRRKELPHKLRRMIDSYHLALDRLTGIDAPIVAAVQGGAGGGGLGLLYCADIAVASNEAKFAVGYSALGLTADGGNTWFLPRMVGLRMAQQLFLLNRPITAQEALDSGIVSQLAAGDAVEREALAIAAKLAAGPTQAFGGIRRLLRQSFETPLGEQLRAEKDSIIRASQSDDVQEGIRAFVEKRKPKFSGR